MSYLPKFYQILFNVFRKKLIKIKAYVLRFPPCGALGCLESSSSP